MSSVLARWTLAERRRFIGWWSLAIFATVALTLGFYPAVEGSSALNDYSRELPESLRELFAGGELDIVSPAGYLDSQVFGSVGPLLLLVLAIGLGAALISGDEERGGLELVLAMPISRRQVVLGRVAALVALIAVATLVLFASLAAGCLVFGLEIDGLNLLAATLSVGLLALAFGCLAFAVGSFGASRGTAIGLSAAAAVLAWVIDGFGQTVDWLEPWSEASPFHLAIGTDPITEGVPVVGWAVLAGISLLLALVSVPGLERRDLR